VTSVSSTAAGSFRVWPTGDPQPATALHSFPATPNQRANMALVPAGRDGKVTVRNVSSGTTHLIVDLQGWFAAPQSPLGVEQFSRSAGMEASTGFLEVGFVNNIGQVVVGRNVDKEDLENGFQWTTISGGEAFTGQPALGQHANGRLQVAAQNLDRDIWARSRATEADVTWPLPWIDLGGSMAAPPAVGRLPDARLVVFGVDVDGQLWQLPQPTANGAYGAWTNLGDADLVGTPTVAPLSDGLQLAALAAGGQVKVAAYRAGALSAWTSLGGSGLTGSPALVVAPGGRLRVVVRGPDGTVLTKQQTTAGAWPATWDPVAGLTAAGSPAAILSPRSGRVELVARAADGTLWSTGETAQGSGVWRPWVAIVGTEGDARTDPIVFPFTGPPGVGVTWTAAYRDVNQVSHLVLVDWPGAGAAAARAEAGADRDRPPRFARLTLPPPPR
jgi:hypothetical protein